ncbi:hypothetical protein L593_14420 [Salinarchaeum sp. Harcht-Bsk1]|nr:hypothetical protein L593_14420 [Salinarchaeum sp. Harcht-Bsk1]
MRRSRAEWMTPADDQILEVLAEEGAGTPSSLAKTLDYNNNYLTTRCTKMTEYGLLEKPARGLYRITDAGESYLAGNLNAEELESEAE